MAALANPAANSSTHTSGERIHREPQMQPEQGRMFSLLLKPPGDGARPLEIPHGDGNPTSSTFGEDPACEDPSHPQLRVLLFFSSQNPLSNSAALCFWLGQLLSAPSQLS